MVNRFQGSDRQKQGGLLATHKQDFNAHHTGGDYRHGATDIDMEPIISSLGGENVQQTLQQMAGFLTAKGTGFISIGAIDGYSDGYTTGSYNVGSPDTPTLTDAMHAAFADDRLQNGGVVLLMAGTYSCRSTIEVPPGITIMGELSGSIIMNHNVESSIFNIKQSVKSIKIGGDAGLGDQDLLIGAPLDVTRLVNLILADNIDGYVVLSGQPSPTMTTVPMVNCDVSSNLECLNTRFIGRLSNGPVLGRNKTLTAIGGYTIGGGTGSNLTLKNCFIDGVRTGFQFTPGNNVLDNLIVDGCRIRAFGEESSSPTFTNNAMGSFTYCNATLNNNFLIGNQLPEGQIWYGFRLTGSVTGDADIIITNNVGKPSPNYAESARLFHTGTSSINVRTIQAGNNWGNAFQSSWFVTVGPGSPSLASVISFDEDERVGDFNGTGAIDLLLSLDYKLPTNIIVFPGTYVVTENGKSNYNFIGQKINDYIPTFDLALGSSAPTDDIGNKYFETGPVIENIHFRCKTGLTSDYHSVSPTETGSSYNDSFIIKSCLFDNSCLSMENHIASAAGDSGDLRKGIIKVIDCNFNQGTDYDDNLCFYLPRTDKVILENCSVSGHGYAGYIGHSDITTFDRPVYIVRNCIFNQSGNIDATSPSANVYFIVDDTTANLFIENTEQFVSSDLTVRTNAIDASLSTSYLRNVFLRANSIVIKDSLFQGPAQSFTISAVDYPLPCAEIIPIQKSLISDSRFLDSFVKVGGSSAAFDDVRASDFVFKNNEITIDDSTFVTQTLLDIDLNPSGGATQSDSQIIISENNFHFGNTAFTDSEAPLHLTVAGGAYNVHGIVQIYARDFEVKVLNNKIKGPTRGFVTSGSLVHSTGLVVNNFFNTASSASANAIPIHISGNSIKVRNQYTTGSSTNTATALYIVGTQIIVNNNHLQMHNNASVSSSMIGIGVFDNRDTSGGFSPPPVIVNGNLFSNSADSGISTVLNVAWFSNQAATEGNGYIIDNVFDNLAGAGAGVISAFRDLGTNLSWIVDRNRNQQVSLTVRGSSGVFGIDGTVKGNLNSTSSYIQVENAFATNEVVQYLYTDSPDTVNFEWFLNAIDFLPIGAKLVSIDVSHQLTSGTPDTTNTLTIQAISSIGSFSSTPTPSGTQTTTSLSLDLNNNPSSGLWVGIIWDCDDSSSSRILEIQGLDILYRM